MKLSLRWKWMLVYLSVGAAVLIFMSLYLNSALNGYISEKFDRYWRSELALSKDYVEHVKFSSWSAVEIDRWADRTGAALGLRVTVIDTSGRVLGDSRVDLAQLSSVENHASRPEVRAARKTGFGKSERVSTTVNTALVYMAATIGTLKKPQGIIRIAVPVSDIEASLSHIQALIWITSGVGFFLIVIAGYVITESATRRIQQMAKGAKRFAKGDFSKIIRVDSRDELTDLCDSLNQMAEELQQSFAEITVERDQLRVILNSMLEGVLVLNESRKVLLCNHRILEIFDFNSPLEGAFIQDVVRDTVLLDAFQRVMADKQDHILKFEPAGPVHKMMEVHISALGKKEESRGLVAVFHDISQLEHLENVRRDFVANVSHELRTPLTAINGYVETLLDRKLPPKKQMDFLQTIHKHSERMTKLVEDLLILSKVESVTSERHLQEVELTVLIREVIARFRNLLEKSNMRLSLQIPDKLPPINGIASELETVLENLLENAIKYGKDGREIILSAHEFFSEIEISIKDKGLGIPVEDRPRIFERFYRVDKGRSRELGGTGLGLSIVKHIVQRHGGQIKVESELGRGSTFIFTLPKMSG